MVVMSEKMEPTKTIDLKHMLMTIIPDLNTTETYGLAERILTMHAFVPDNDESLSDVSFYIQNGVITMA